MKNIYKIIVQGPTLWLAFYLNSGIVKSRLWSQIYFDLKSGSTNDYLDDFMKVI